MNTHHHPHNYDTEAADITLDQAQDAFVGERNIQSAAVLLREGLTYWNDDMISDETFEEEVIKPLVEFLEEFKN